MNSIKLKSEILQQILGIDEIKFFEQLEDKFKFNGSSNTITIPEGNISEEDIIDLIDDLRHIAEETTWSFSVLNVPDNLKEKFLIYANKDPMVFIDIGELEEESKIIERWENTELQISGELYELLKEYYDKDKFSLKDIYLNPQENIIFGKIENQLEFMSLFPSERYVGTILEIRICSKEDLQKLMNNEALRNIGNIYLYISDMSLLPLEDIEELSKKTNIVNIFISNEQGYEKEHNDKPKRYNYTVEEYKKLIESVDEILEDVDLNSPEIEKFLKVYKKLGKKIEYDFNDEGEPNDRDEAHNLKGGLLEGRCVCEGYALALKQVLKCAGIDCIYICDRVERDAVDPRCLNDTDEKPFHAWNQVKIDGIWYNCDLTWDAIRIVDNCELDYCLQSDKEFINHDTYCSWREECFQSYDRRKIESVFGCRTQEEYLEECQKKYTGAKGITEFRSNLTKYYTSTQEDKTTIDLMLLKIECELLKLNWENEVAMARGEKVIENRSAKKIAIEPTVAEKKAEASNIISDLNIKKRGVETPSNEI